MKNSKIVQFQTLLVLVKAEKTFLSYGNQNRFRQSETGWKEKKIKG